MFEALKSFAAWFADGLTEAEAGAAGPGAGEAATEDPSGHWR